MSNDRKPRSSGNDGQFRKGRSGNSRGRPKGSRNTKTIVKELAAKTQVVNHGGTKRRVTTVELLLLALLDRAMSGDVPANKYLESLRSRLVPDDSSAGYLVVPEVMSMEQWIAEAERDNALKSMPTID